MSPAGLAQPHQKQTQGRLSLPRLGGQGGVGASSVCSGLLLEHGSLGGSGIGLEAHGSASGQAELEGIETATRRENLDVSIVPPAMPQSLTGLKLPALDIGWFGARGSHGMNQQQWASFSVANLSVV